MTGLAVPVEVVLARLEEDSFKGHGHHLVALKLHDLLADLAAPQVPGGGGVPSGRRCWYRGRFSGGGWWWCGEEVPAAKRSAVDKLEGSILGVEDLLGLKGLEDKGHRAVLEGVADPHSYGYHKARVGAKVV